MGRGRAHIAYSFFSSFSHELIDGEKSYANFESLEQHVRKPIEDDEDGHLIYRIGDAIDGRCKCITSKVTLKWIYITKTWQSLSRTWPEINDSVVRKRSRNIHYRIFRLIISIVFDQWWFIMPWKSKGPKSSFTILLSATCGRSQLSQGNNYITRWLQKFLEWFKQHHYIFQVKLNYTKRSYLLDLDFV